MDHCTRYVLMDLFYEKRPILFSTEKAKSLEESAREFQAKYERKTELKEVEIKTGEEGESNVLQVWVFTINLARENPMYYWYGGSLLTYQGIIQYTTGMGVYY